MSFENVLYLALVIALVPIFWWGYRRRKTVGHTQVGIHKNLRSTPFIGWIPIAAIALMWVGFCIAYAGLRQTTYADTQTAETRDIVIMVDVSGSMSSVLQNKDQQDFVSQTGTPTPAGAATTQQKPATRANAARMGVKMFAEQRKGDRIALLLFDDQVYDACLFTFDQTIISKKIPLIDQYNGGGTNFDGPNPDSPYSKVGAIQGAINFFKDSGQAKTKVLIMVTDGEDSISTKRYVQLMQQLQDSGIHMYVLGVGESWTGGSMVDLRKFTEEEGGKVFLIGDTQAMKDGFNEINKLEKSQIVIERSSDYKPLYWMVLYPAAGFLLLFLGIAAIVREED